MFSPAGDVHFIDWTSEVPVELSAVLHKGGLLQTGGSVWSESSAPPHSLHPHDLWGTQVQMHIHILFHKGKSSLLLTNTVETCCNYYSYLERLGSIAGI